MYKTSSTFVLTLNGSSFKIVLVTQFVDKLDVTVHVPRENYRPTRTMFSRLQRRRSNLQDMGRLSKSCPAVDNPTSDDSSASESSYNESSGSSASLSDPFAESSEEVKAPISRAEKELTRKSLRRAKQREVEQKRNLEQNRISMDDYLGKQAQFRIWLLEEQKKQTKDLSSPKRKTYFKMFVRLWNKRHLPAKFYESRLSWHMEGEIPAPEDKRSPLYSDRPRFSLLQNSPALDPSIFPHTIDLSTDSIIPGSPDPSPFSTFGKGSPAVNNLTPFRFSAQSGKTSVSQMLESAGPGDGQKGKTPIFRTIRNNVFKFGANKENTAHHSHPLSAESGEYLRTATISPRKKMISVCQARSLDRKVVNWSPRGHLKLNAVDSPRCPSPFSSHISPISGITTTASSKTSHLDLAVPTCSEVYHEVKDVIESSSPTYADIPFAKDENFCDVQIKAVTFKGKIHRRRSRSVDDMPVYAVPKKQDRERAWSEKQVVSEEFSVSPPPVPPKRFDPHVEGLGIAFSAPSSAQKDVPVTDQHQPLEGKKEEETDHGKEASKKSANPFKGRLPWFGKKITSRRRSRSCEALSPSMQSATVTLQADGDSFPLVRMDRSPTLNRRTLTRPFKLPGHQSKVTDNKDKLRPKPSFSSPAPRLTDISDKIKAREFTVPTPAEDKPEGIKPIHKLKFELAEYSSSPMRLGSRSRMTNDKDTVSSLKGPTLRRRSRSMEQIASPGMGQSDHYDQMTHYEQNKVHSKYSWLDHSKISKLYTHSSKVDQSNEGHDLLASTNQTDQFVEASNNTRETKHCSSNNDPTNHCNSVLTKPIGCLDNHPVCSEALSSKFPPPPPPLTMPMSTDTCLEEPDDLLPPPTSPLHCELYEEIKSSVHSKLSSLVHKLSDADLSLDLSESLALEQLQSSPKRLGQNQDLSDTYIVNTTDLVNPVHKESGCQEDNSFFHDESDTVEKAHGTRINASVTQDFVMMDCTENFVPTATPTNSYQNSEDPCTDSMEALLQHDDNILANTNISQSNDSCKALVVDMKTYVDELVSTGMEKPEDRQSEVHAALQDSSGKYARLKEPAHDQHQSSETVCQREVVRNIAPHQELAFSVSVSAASPQSQVCKLLTPARKTQVMRRRSRSVGDRSLFTQVMVNNTKTHRAPICKDMLAMNQAPANVVSSLTFTPAVPLYTDVKEDVPVSTSVNTSHVQACQDSNDSVQCSDKISNTYSSLSLTPTKSQIVEKKQALKQEKTNLVSGEQSSLHILSKETPQALKKKHLHEGTNEQAPQDEQKPQALVKSTERQTLKDKETEPELQERNHQCTQNVVKTQCGEQTAFTRHLLDQNGVSQSTGQTSTQPECVQPFKTSTLASIQHKFGTSLRSTPSRHRRRSRSVGDLTGVEEDSGVQTGEGKGFASVRSFWNGLRGKVEENSSSVTLQRKPSTMRRLQQQLYGTSTPVAKEKSCDISSDNQFLVSTVATLSTEKVGEASSSRLVDDKPKASKFPHTDCDASRDLAQPPSQCKAEKTCSIDTACIQLEKSTLSNLGNEPFTVEKSLSGTQREGKPRANVQVQNQTCKPSLQTSKEVTSSNDEESGAMKTSPFVTVRRQSSRKQCVVPPSAKGDEQVQTKTSSVQKGHHNVKHTKISGSEQSTPVTVHHRGLNKPVSEKILSSVEKDSKSCVKVDLKLSATAMIPTCNKTDNVLSGSKTTMHVPSGGKKKTLPPPNILPKPSRRPMTVTTNPQQSSAKEATSCTSIAVVGAPRKRRSQDLDRGSQPGKRCVTGENQDKGPVTRSTAHQGIGIQEQLSVPTTASSGVDSINKRQNAPTPMTVTAVILEGMSQTRTSTPVGARPIRSVKRRSTEKQDNKDLRPVKRRSSGKEGQLTDVPGKCDKNKDVLSSGRRKPIGWKENGIHSPVVTQSPVVRRTSSRLESQTRPALVSDCRKKTESVSVRRQSSEKGTPCRTSAVKRQSSGRDSSPRSSIGRRQSGVRATLSRSGSVRAQVTNLNTQLAHTFTPVNRTNSGRGAPLVLSAQKKSSTISGRPSKTALSNNRSATSTPSAQGSASAHKRSNGRGKPDQTSFGSQRKQTRNVQMSNTAVLSDSTTKQSGPVQAPDQLKSVPKLTKDREPTHSSPLPSVVKRLSTIKRSSGCSPIKRRSGGGSGFTPATKRSSIGSVKSRRDSGKVKRTDSSRSSRGPDSDIDEHSSTSSRNTSFRKHGKTPQSPTFLRITQRLGVYEEQDSDDSMDITPADEELAHKIIAGLQKAQTLKVDTANHCQPSFSNNIHHALSSPIQTKAVELAPFDKKAVLSFGEGGDVYKDDSNMETDIDAWQGDDQSQAITCTKTSKLSTLV